MSCQSGLTRPARGFILWPAILAVLLIVAGAGAFFYFMKQRARSLAAEARESLQNNELRYALLQAESARRLRPEDPVVLRSLAATQFAVGDAQSLDTWQRISELDRLSLRDLREKTVAAARFGDEEKFGEALKQLGPEAPLGEVPAWRGRRALLRRDYAAAEKHLRAAVQADPASLEYHLELARFLVVVGSPEALAEAALIVGRMADGPEGNAALAFGLQSVPAGPATRRAWAERALSAPDPGNPALLPAATVMIEDRHRSLDEMVAQLNGVFLEAPLAQRENYARWLSEKNRPGDTLSFIFPDEARSSRTAFLVRAEALSSVGDWHGLADLVEAGSPVNEPVTFLLRARADWNLDRKTSARIHWKRAIRAAVPRVILAETLEQVDKAGQQELADETLLELCGEPSSAEYALRVARWRFTQRGEPRLRQEALRRVIASSIRSTIVADAERQQRLLAGKKVNPEETGRALAEAPAEIDFRLTHALALLVAGRTAEARLALGPCEPLKNQLLPAQKAIVAAVLGGSGSQSEAIDLVRTINPAHLTDGEYLLIYRYTVPSMTGNSRGKN